MSKLKVKLNLDNLYDVPQELLQFKHSYVGEPNFIKISVTDLQANDANMELFNKIYFWVKDNIKTTITRTASGGIATKGKLKYTPQYDIKQYLRCIELTIVHPVGRWRIQFGGLKAYNDDNRKMTGNKAYMQFVADLKKHDINIFDDKYMVRDKFEGKRINAEIEKPLIYTPLKDDEIGFNNTFINCHHADFNSSFASGLVKYYPEFLPVIQHYYDNRHNKNNQKYKDILNMLIGFCHSARVGYRHVNLAKAAINDNNKRVRELALELYKKGYRVLLYNTDGIWYDSNGKSLPPYENSTTGTDLGQWKNNHKWCTLRIRSAGSYEFIEQKENKQKVTVVQRGRTKLDEVKCRDDWDWGDIFNPNNKKEVYYLFDYEKGIFKHTEE